MQKNKVYNSTGAYTKVFQKIAEVIIASRIEGIGVKFKLKIGNWHDLEDLKFCLCLCKNLIYAGRNKIKEKLPKPM